MTVRFPIVDRPTELRRPALAILREQRLCVTRAAVEMHLTTMRPSMVEAAVKSSREGGPTYAVDLLLGQWTCTCQPSQSGNLCAHVLAVRMVTGGDR